MRIRTSHIPALLLVVQLSVPLQAQQAVPGVAGDRSRVSMNQVWNSLPDFVCTEKIVSETLDKGKIKGHRVLESVFMTQRKMETRDGSNVYSIVESRELVKIDGKAVPQNTKMPSVPLLFDGLAANILFVSDVPRYYAGGTQNLEGRLAIRIGFITRNSRDFLQMEFPAAVTGVQIGTSSSKTLHVKSRIGSPHGGSNVPISAEFQSIEIDGNSYWLPSAVRAQIALEKREIVTYSAEYTGCKKFDVQVEIRPVGVSPPQ
jgi:hypothetical protein